MAVVVIGLVVRRSGDLELFWGVVGDRECCAKSGRLAQNGKAGLGDGQVREAVKGALWESSRRGASS